MNDVSPPAATLNHAAAPLCPPTPAIDPAEANPAGPDADTVPGKTPPVATNKSPACAAEPNTTDTDPTEPANVAVPCCTTLNDEAADVGVTEAEAADAGPVPTLLVAVTLNVYAVPFVNPDTTAEVAPDVDAVAPPGVAVTVYPVIAEPPLDAGADHDTVAAAFPATAPTPVGAPGTVGGGGGPAVAKTTMPAV